MATKKIPVTIISGFLGAGKTTLIKHLLGQDPAFQIGLVAGCFAEAGMDHRSMDSNRKELEDIDNAYICNRVEADPVTRVKEMLRLAGDSLDHLIIESSGLTTPAPLLQAVITDPPLCTRLELESVVTVIDAEHLQCQIDDDLVREQITFADLLIINKVDLVSTQTLENIRKDIRMVNRTASVVETSHARLALAAVLGAKRFSLPHLLTNEPDILGVEYHAHESDASITSCSVDTPSALDAERFNLWINQLIQNQGAQLLRMKGVLNFSGEARQVHFQSVHRQLEAGPGRRWLSDEIRDSHFLFIGRDLDCEKLKQDFLQCLHTG